MDGLDSSYSAHVGDFERNRTFVKSDDKERSAKYLKVVSFNELVRATLNEEQRLRREDDKDSAAVALVAAQPDTTSDPNRRE